MVCICARNIQYFFIYILLIPQIATVIYVQLETISFTIDEEVGFVEVCVNISSHQECPIEFVAGVSLSTRSDTAGAVINVHGTES